MGIGYPAGLMLRKLNSPFASVVNLPRRFISACSGSWFSYRPTGEACQTSTSAAATGLPSGSRTQPLKNNAGPGVGDRRSDPPFSVLGDSALQNGPRRLAELSVAALGPLFMRQTRVERPSVPAISLTSLWLSVVSCPSAAT